MLVKSNNFKRNSQLKGLEVKPREIFADNVVDFLNDFSNELRKNNKYTNLKDISHLSLWCSKKNILTYKKKYLFDKIRIGRGLIFHICPSNVPTNFFYSFVFGLLSGNSNIVKLPKKDFLETKIILGTLNKIFKLRKYKMYKKLNYFIKIDKEDPLIAQISNICNVRMIWGGDETINKLRKICIPERSIDLVFPDRYSFSLINISEYERLKKHHKKILAKKFFYDTYLMNQGACNSPHVVFWIGKKKKDIIDIFWKNILEIAEDRFNVDDKISINKYTNLFQNIIKYKSFEKINLFSNHLYVIDLKNNVNNIENIRGISGTFFQLNLDKLEDISKFITKKCQTITYHGFKKKDFNKLIFKSNIEGVDRIVPIGKSFEMNSYWDGYDLIGNLSRVIHHE